MPKGYDDILPETARQRWLVTVDDTSWRFFLFFVVFSPSPRSSLVLWPRGEHALHRTVGAGGAVLWIVPTSREGIVYSFWDYRTLIAIAIALRHRNGVGRSLTAQRESPNCFLTFLDPEA